MTARQPSTTHMNPPSERPEHPADAGKGRKIITHVTSSPLRVLRMPTAPGEPFGHHVLPEGTEIQIYEGGDPPNMPDEAHDSQPTTTKNP